MQSSVGILLASIARALKIQPFFLPFVHDAVSGNCQENESRLVGSSSLPFASQIKRKQWRPGCSELNVKAPLNMCLTVNQQMS